MNVPIFTGWLYENQIASAKENACSALAAWKLTELNVLLDVVTAYNAYTTAVQSVEYSDEYLKYSQEAYDAALLGYRMGANSIVDVLNAQMTLSNARSQWIQTRTQLFTQAGVEGEHRERQARLPGQVQHHQAGALEARANGRPRSKSRPGPSQDFLGNKC